jgi:hypothetical protein
MIKKKNRQFFKSFWFFKMIKALMNKKEDVKMNEKQK